MIKLLTPRVKINFLVTMKASYMRWYNEEMDEVIWYVATNNGWNVNIDIEEEKQLEKSYKKITGQNNDD